LNPVHANYSRLVITILTLWVCLGMLGVLSTSASESGSFREQFGLPGDPEPVLEEVLSRDEFKPDPNEEYWKNIEEALGEMLRRILKWIFDRFPEIELDGEHTILDLLWIVVKALLIGFCILCLVYVAKHGLDYFLKRSGAARSGDVPDRREPYKNSLQLAELARSAADRNDYGLAVILMFRSVLARLDEQDLITHHPGRTNREILRAVSSNPSLARALSGMVPLFNRVRYGNAHCDRAQYERFMALCRDLTEGTAIQ
jgi:hypothetical protein